MKYKQIVDKCTKINKNWSNSEHDSIQYPSNYMSNFTPNSIESVLCTDPIPGIHHSQQPQSLKTQPSPAFQNWTSSIDGNGTGSMMNVPNPMLYTNMNPVSIAYLTDQSSFTVINNQNFSLGITQSNLLNFNNQTQLPILTTSNDQNNRNDKNINIHKYANKGVKIPRQRKSRLFLFLNTF